LERQNQNKDLHNLVKENKQMEQIIADKDSHINDLEFMIKDLKSEIDFSKSNHKNISSEENHFFLNNLNLKLTDQLAVKDSIIEQIKQDSEKEINTLKSQLGFLNIKLEKYECLQDESKTLKVQNDKFKEKLNELKTLKEKLNDYNDLALVNENKQKIIDSINLEKRGLQYQLDRLTNDLSNERNKITRIELQKKSLESEVNIMKVMLNETSNNNYSTKVINIFNKIV